MVPATAQAHLNDVHPERAERNRERREFGRGPDPAGVRTEFVAVGVGDVDQFRAAADTAGALRRFAMELGRSDEVWVGVAVLRPETAEHRPQGRRSRQGIGDDVAWPTGIGDRFRGTWLRRGRDRRGPGHASATDRGTAGSCHRTRVRVSSRPDRGHWR
jgi:hypothetical protein